MDSSIARLDAWLIALAFGVSMLASWYSGLRHGRQKSQRGQDAGDKLTDASIALLGLLLAFTFAMALGRYEQRRQGMVAESNAIGDFFTCASLLKEPHRSQLQNAIRDYAKIQLDTRPEMLQTVEERKAIDRSQKAVAEMTGIVDQAIEDGTPLVIPLTNTLNNVTSSTAARIAAFEERMPWSIVALLFLCSVVPSFLIGEKQGISRTLYPSESISFVVLVTLVIVVTIDLNQPHRGLIRINQSSLTRLIQSMSG